MVRDCRRSLYTHASIHTISKLRWLYHLTVAASCPHRCVTVAAEGGATSHALTAAMSSELLLLLLRMTSTSPGILSTSSEASGHASTTAPDDHLREGTHAVIHHMDTIDVIPTHHSTERT